jgi:uncharacterized protein
MHVVQVLAPAIIGAVAGVALGAVLAIPLLAFRHAGRRTLLAGCLVFLAFFAAHGVTMGEVGTIPEPPADAAAFVGSRIQQILAYRPQLWQARTLLQIFAYFLLGLLCWRQGLVGNPAPHRSLLKRTALWGAAFGLAGKTIVVFELLNAHPAEAAALKAVASPALTLGYGAAGALLSMEGAWRGRLAHVAPLGRMALTNYLLQSVVMALLFSPAALALHLSMAACVLVALAASGVQIVLSGWWLRRYQFGPAEWLWRTLTYGRVQPMRIGSGFGLAAAGG